MTDLERFKAVYRKLAKDHEYIDNLIYDIYSAEGGTGYPSARSEHRIRGFIFTSYLLDITEEHMNMLD